MILDFFAIIPDKHQAAWATLIKSDPANKLEIASTGKSAPYLESQIKLLYTAMTRCCDRLVFVETKKTKAGVAFFR